MSAAVAKSSAFPRPSTALCTRWLNCSKVSIRFREWPEFKEFRKEDQEWECHGQERRRRPDFQIISRGSCVKCAGYRRRHSAIQLREGASDNDNRDHVGDTLHRLRQL